MSGYILCQTKKAQRPYFIENISMNIYSIEELCYYLYHNLYLADHTVFNEELCNWLRDELELVHLAAKLKQNLERNVSVEEMIYPVFKEINYLTYEEMKGFNSRIVTYGKEKAAVRQKRKGDALTENGMYVNAIRVYQKLLEREDLSEQRKGFAASVRYNLGCAYSYLFQMEKAQECFLEAYREEGAERLVLLGDLLYHGPRNDLPRDYAPKHVIPLLNALADRIIAVRGNCDAEVDQMVLNFPVLADYAVLPVGQRLVYVTHGHVFNLNHLPPLAPGDILLHGHTHVPAWTNFGQGSLYLNPGSVSLPKENTAHSYMTLEGSTACWKTMEGACYHQLQL